METKNQGGLRMRLSMLKRQILSPEQISSIVNSQIEFTPIEKKDLANFEMFVNLTSSSKTFKEITILNHRRYSDAEDNITEFIQYGTWLIGNGSFGLDEYDNGEIKSFPSAFNENQVHVIFIQTELSHSLKKRQKFLIKTIRNDLYIFKKNANKT
jgi:hypothetical protein